MAYLKSKSKSYFIFIAILIDNIFAYIFLDIDGVSCIKCALLCQLYFY